MNVWAWLTSSVIVNVVARVLLALGVSVVSYTGFSYLLSQITTQIHSFLSGFSADVLNVLGMCRIDLAINLVLSAWAARIALTSLKSFRVGG